MKAVGHGIGEIDPIDIEVEASEALPPELRLRDSAAIHAERVGLTHFAVSLCHEGDLATAYVVGHNAPMIDARGLLPPAAADGARRLVPVPEQYTGVGDRPGTRATRLAMTEAMTRETMREAR
jgi:hypothetical protein